MCNDPLVVEEVHVNAEVFLKDESAIECMNCLAEDDTLTFCENQLLTFECLYSDCIHYDSVSPDLYDPITAAIANTFHMEIVGDLCSQQPTCVADAEAVTDCIKTAAISFTEETLSCSDHVSQLQACYDASACSSDVILSVLAPLCPRPTEYTSHDSLTCTEFVGPSFSTYGDGVCNILSNTEECGYDGGNVCLKSCLLHTELVLAR